MRMTRLAARHEVPLVVRASTPRTFLGLGVFTEAALLFSGSYLFLKALWKPLETGEAAVIVAGLLLTLASFLLFYLVRPRIGDELARTDELEDQPVFVEVPLTALGASLEVRKRAEQALKQDGLPGPM
jgi:hypothetical protein